MYRDFLVDFCVCVCVFLALPPSHFALDIMERMLEKNEAERPNVREIIPLLTPLQHDITKTNKSPLKTQFIRSPSKTRSKFWEMKSRSKNSENRVFRS